ncbi:MAG: PKD domain-containing protein, partial [Bacteroidia bacterium]|nr:PKD domain-containing protein [Bacteroidia bacterium]
MKAIWKDVGYFLFLLVFAGVNSQVKAACPAGTTCLPPTTQYCCGLGIYNFTFNTINNTTGDGIDGYQDYSCTIQTTVTEGNTYSVDIETNDTYTENVFIWIDYNNDSTFDDSEKSFSSIGALQFHSGNMIIGSNAVLNTDLRMRVGSDYSGLGIYTPCDSSAYGQFEDYTIIIQANTSPAVADFSSSDTINCNGYVQFTDQSLNVPTSWFWDFGDGNTDTTKNPMYIYSTPGMYSVKLRVSNAFGNDSITKTNYVDITSISGARSIECAPNTTGWCCSMGIYNVTFNGINNTTGDGSEGYQDYTCTDTTTIQINKKYLLSIQTDNTYEQNVRAWIDLNNDGVLDTLTELVLSSDNILEFHSDSIIIQGNPVYNTPLRLRIAADYYFQPIPTPCNDVTYSQVEDYSVIIVPDTIPPVAKFSADATLSCDGIVTFTDNSTNSPTSWFWDFGDGNTDTIQSPTHTYSTDTTYSISLIASNQWGSDTLIKSNYVTVSIGGGPIAASCTSGTDNGGLGFGITNFTFGSINSTTGDASENYQDYTCSQGTNLIEGKIYNMSITVDNPSTHHVRVWADFNNDAAFDTTTELLLSVNTVLNVNQDVSIPTGAVLNTPLRLRVSADWSGSAEPTPCKLLDYGQAEDYSIVILVNNDPPAADFSVNDSITCDGNVNFSDISQNVPTSWFWDFGDGNTDTTQNPSHNYSIDSTYNVMFVAINANGSDTLTKNSFIQVKQDSLPNNPSCTPATLGNCCGYGILNVNLNTINNTSADGSEGYQDFACQHRTYLTQGSNYTISIQTSVANSQDTRAWIDYDNDGFFNDSTELILSANNAYDPSNTFTVSSSAPLDTPLRMRVSTDYSGSNPTSCVDLDFGQAE